MVDLNRFAQKLNAQLTGRAVGYQYALYQGDTLKLAGGGGFAVLASQAKMTADRRMTTASMSKTITATAFMRALEIVRGRGAQISLETKIAPYLPASWTRRGPHVHEMTFKHLLTHVSGLRSVPDEDLFGSLQQTIAQGATDANWQKYAYQNCNFSLFRILIPNLLYGIAVSAEPDTTALQADIAALQAELATAPPPMKAALVAQIKALKTKLQSLDSAAVHTAKLYVAFVQQEVFGPIGLGHVSLAPTGPQEAIAYYNFTNPSQLYVDKDYKFYLLRVGAGHWFMSSKEFGLFIAKLRSGHILSPASFQQMIDHNLGLGTDTSTVDGPNWNHNGGFATGNGAGMVGDWMALPNQVTTVILVNSQGGITKSLENLIRDAYNPACLTPPTTDTPLAAASVSNRIAVVMRGADSHIYVNQALDGQPFGGWLEVESGATVPAAAVTAAALGTHVLLFARGWDNHVYGNVGASGQPFAGWKGVEGGMVTDAALAAAAFAGRIYVFAKGLDNRIFLNTALPGQPFGRWQEVDGQGTTDAAVAAAALGQRIYVFAKGIHDHRVYVTSAMAGQPFDGWGHGWTVLPGITTDAAPAAAALGNRLYVFATGVDQRIYVNQALDGQAFQGWQEVDGQGTTDAAVAAAALGQRIYVFAKGIHDHRVYVTSAMAGQPFDGWGHGWVEVQW